jgi:PRTRC genetic system protein B
MEKKSQNEQAAYEATAAIIFYSLRHAAEDRQWPARDPFDIKESFMPEKPGSYASIHPVVSGELCEGRPLKRDAVIELCHRFIPQAVRPVFIPESVIAFTPGFEVVWWVPQKSRHLFFKKASGIKSGVMPLPALLFRARDSSLDVWALKENTRPVPETDLYYPPFPNMLDPGYVVCLGNNKTPGSVSLAQTAVWERLFFKSYFTGADISETRVCGISWKKLWAELSAGKHESFPMEHLIRFGKLKKIFDSNREE